MNKTWHMRLAICDVFWWNAVECNLVSRTRARAYMETTQYAPHLRILMRWIWSIASIGHNHGFCVRDLSVERKKKKERNDVSHKNHMTLCMRKIIARFKTMSVHWNQRNHHLSLYSSMNSCDHVMFNVVQSTCILRQLFIKKICFFRSWFISLSTRQSVEMSDACVVHRTTIIHLNPTRSSMPDSHVMSWMGPLIYHAENETNHVDRM